MSISVDKEWRLAIVAARASGAVFTLFTYAANARPSLPYAPPAIENSISVSRAVRVLLIEPT